MVPQKTGQILVLVNGKRRARPFLDITTRWERAASEQGLLSVAFDPGYAKNHRIYVDYTDTKGDTRVVRYTTNGTVGPAEDAEAELLFVDQPYENHNGGLLALGRNGRLYVGMGDGGSGGDPEGPRPEPGASLLGKLLQQIAPNNLTCGLEAGRRTGSATPGATRSTGATGDLWIGDVGQGAWEEVELGRRRASTELLNFGWSAFEGDAKFKDEPA